MSRRSKVQEQRLAEIEAEFLPLLIRCLKACEQGRWGLFGQNDGLDDSRWTAWPEACHLKDLALEIRAIRSQTGSANRVCDQFLETCSLRGPNVTGEPKLAAALLNEIGTS